MIYQFLEDIRMAARSHPNFDKANIEEIADIYGHSLEYVQNLVTYERDAQKERDKTCI